MGNDWVQNIAIAVIGLFGAGGLGVALIGYFKDRKKDEATAKLTDVEALQKQVVLLTTITDYLRKENSQLQHDLDEESARARTWRLRVLEVEEELQNVRRTAGQTQQQCDELSAKLRAILGSGDNDQRTNH